MAKEKSPEEIAAAEEKKKLQAERKQLKNDQKAQKKEAKRRAKEIAKRQDELDEDDEGGGFATFLTTLFIVALWIVVICVVVKMDVGGFGSSVLAPILKDVPVVNMILPGTSVTETTDKEAYNGYSSLREAVDQIERLEKQLEQVQNENKQKDAEVETLKAEVTRLQPFENMQADFQRIRNEFYEEVVYNENGPGAEAYQKYYESIDPTTAEYIYKQVVSQLQEDSEVREFAATYENMKPKAAAAVFEEMGKKDSDLKLVARILEAMSTEGRAKIMDAMDSAIAAKLTKIMDPNA